jgi:fibronectin type 3 domain-containing protein
VTAHRGTSYQQLNTTVNPDTHTSYSDTTTQDGLTYDHIVESVDTAGNTRAPSNMADVNIPLGRSPVNARLRKRPAASSAALSCRRSCRRIVGIGNFKSHPVI